MKKILFYFILCFTLFFIGTTAYAGLDDFTGTWKNVDQNTGGITKLRIRVDGSEVRVHAWGKCHPKDCDWGVEKAYAYGPNASSNVISNARVITASYKTKFSRTILVITMAGSNKLKAETYTRFTDNSGRNNYTNGYKFKRVRIQAAVSGTGRPMRPIKPVKEDCISFNPNNARVVRAQGRWKIADGSHWMFDFGNKKNEADKSLRTIKRYRMNQSCFVGRPDPSLKYMLISDSAPAGGLRGEDCISFNLDTIEVENVNGRWKIVDGSHWVFDFEGNEAEARKSFRIIKKHGFNKSCFVGRPDPSFQYLRR
ncbi:MAG: hypothetical protein JRG81_15575 [Deltaproteobacteria bacterium]|nr:hypothetical protein [Deltaproteobacteria bacterium]